MKALVIALCYLAAVRAVRGASPPSPQRNEPLKNTTWHQQPLQNYQDAWKSINQTVGRTYYLLRSTYNNDSVWGNNFSCLSVRVTNRYERLKIVTYNTTYKNATTSQWKSMTENVTAVKENGYNVTNIIQWTTQNKTFNDTVVFTDGQTCDLLSIPYKNNGYELWVRSDYLNNTPTCCNFLFDLLTLGNTTYNISTPECLTSSAGSIRIIS